MGMRSARALALGLGFAALLQPELAHGDDVSPTLAALEREQTALFERVAPSVVFIASPSGFGSGFFVSDRGHVLTNRHVVQGVDAVRVVMHDGRKLGGKVVARGAGGLDVALVKLDVTGTPPLRIVSSNAARIGGWVGSVGHGRGGIWTFSAGLISNLWGDARRSGVMQTQIPLNPGASGGPIFDRTGAVVGIVTAGVVDAQAINFAIRSDTAVGGLGELCQLTECMLVDAPPGAAVQLDGHFVGNGPRLALLVGKGDHVLSTVLGGRRTRRTVHWPQERAVDLRER